MKGLTPSALYMGVLAAFVGYSASFAIVLAGLKAGGATEAQAATGLFFATIGMGLCSIWLPLVTRTPAAVAWSTPGAAFLAASAIPPGGFAEVVGALLIFAGLMIYFLAPCTDWFLGFTRLARGDTTLGADPENFLGTEQRHTLW